MNTKLFRSISYVSFFLWLISFSLFSATNYHRWEHIIQNYQYTGDRILTINKIILLLKDGLDPTEIYDSVKNWEENEKYFYKREPNLNNHRRWLDASCFKQIVKESIEKKIREDIRIAILTSNFESFLKIMQEHAQYDIDSDIILDEDNNTIFHYAAGYASTSFFEQLLNTSFFNSSICSKKNSLNQTPSDLFMARGESYWSWNISPTMLTINSSIKYLTSFKLKD